MSQWEENQQVSLKDELPRLKAMIYSAREREEAEIPGSEEYELA